MRGLWKQEEVPTTRTISKEDQACEEHFRRSHTRKADGRYAVRLPTVDPLPDLSETRLIARVQRSVEAKFRQNASFHELYKDFMQQYESLRHMTLVTIAADGAATSINYLPHHGVTRESSSTTKLRVVFNGSTRTSNGTTLNKHLLTGENLLPALRDILLRGAGIVTC